MNKYLCGVFLFVVTGIVVVFVVGKHILKDRNIKKTTITKSQEIKNPFEVCIKKKIIWGKKDYPIAEKNPELGLLLHVENVNTKDWDYFFEGLTDKEMIGELKATKDRLGKPEFHENLQKRLIYCLASISFDKDYKKNTKDQKVTTGVELSVKSKDHNFASIKLNVTLKAFRYTDESYRFDEMMQEISSNFTLVKESPNALRLHFEKNENIPQAFSYSFTDLNNEFIDGAFIDFISNDNGKTWTPEVVKK